jgi:hypothetical protein
MPYSEDEKLLIPLILFCLFYVLTLGVVMKRKSIFFFSFCLMFAGLLTFIGVYAIPLYFKNYQGVLIDAKTRLPIANATVQIKNTSYKTNSNVKGFFEIPYHLFVHSFKEIFNPLVFDKDTLQLFSNTHQFVQYSVRANKKEYELIALNASASEVTYFNYLGNKEIFDYLAGNPLTQPFAEVKSVKFIYDFKQEKIYFINYKAYPYHSHFAFEILKFDTKKDFGLQYYNNPDRTYFIGEICHYTASNIYTFEMFAGTEMTCEQLKELNGKMVSNTFIGNRISYLSHRDKGCSDLKTITHNELYKGQNYQALNYAESYGYLKFVKVTSADFDSIGKYDIVILNDIPLNVSVNAGIITDKFQTPLSHLNVLSHNRNTPNMALRSAWDNPKLRKLKDKLVYLRVAGDTFCIKEASLSEAQKYWQEKESRKTIYLQKNEKDSALVDLSKRGISSVDVIGGKAANFSELLHIDGINTPEGAFAIPFYFYSRHLKKYGLDAYIQKMVKDPRFFTDKVVKQKYLSVLRDSIVHSPLDPVLVKRITALFRSKCTSNSLRFRSSTNAEDIPGFNGAGLYESHTGKIESKTKPIDKAIKKVWASLWNIDAVEEREYFKIDHQSVAMGILVHRTFSNEDANGVVITCNPYNKTLPAYVVNVQAGELAVVGNKKNIIADEIIIFLFGAIPQQNYSIQYISHSSLPEMKGKTVMTEQELVELRTAVDKVFYHYCALYDTCKHLDIEFKLDSGDSFKRKLYIKQVRLY